MKDIADVVEADLTTVIFTSEAIMPSGKFAEVIGSNWSLPLVGLKVVSEFSPGYYYFKWLKLLNVQVPTSISYGLQLQTHSRLPLLFIVYCF